jgi:hypothetical protein
LIEAEDFEIAAIIGDYFGGLCRLEPKIVMEVNSD